MKLTLIIDSSAQAALSSANLPGLERLLAIGSRSRIADSLEALICKAAGIEQQVDWPVAAISSLADGLHGKSPDSAYWLFVDFVHFVLQRDYFTLAEVLPVSLGETAGLVTALNQHFAEDGLAFVQGHRSGRCYLHVHAAPEIQTTRPQQVIGLETTSYMPRGSGATKWNRLMNEMQMLLFEHPVNQAREQCGELAANSVWLSGGGVLPPMDITSIDPRTRIAGETMLIQGLNMLRQQAALDMPKDAQAALSTDADNLWLCMDSQRFADAGNADESWFTPLLLALKQGKLQQLDMLFAQHGNVLDVQVLPRDTWKFWRKPLPLAGLLSVMPQV